MTADPTADLTADLPAGLDAPALDDLLAAVAAAGQRLLAAQPARALGEEARMRQCFAEACAAVLQDLGATLAARTPGVPVVQAGLTPDRLPELDGLYWLCDPLDGAIQYLAGLPMWTVTLTLMQGATPLLAIVSDPCLQRTYHAVRHGGAYGNGEVLDCGAPRALAWATVGTSFPNWPRRPQAELDAFLHKLGNVVPAVLAQRWIGSATLSLALVASGRLDAYWECGRHLVDWLPGLLIAQEAGARITSLGERPLGEPGSGLVVAAAPIHGALQALLAA